MACGSFTASETTFTLPAMTQHTRCVRGAVKHCRTGVFPRNTTVLILACDGSLTGALQVHPFQ